MYKRNKQRDKKNVLLFSLLYKLSLIQKKKRKSLKFRMWIPLFSEFFHSKLPAHVWPLKRLFFQICDKLKSCRYSNFLYVATRIRWIGYMCKTLWQNYRDNAGCFYIKIFPILAWKNFFLHVYILTRFLLI